MPNLTALCHEHKCDKCSTYLEHLLIGAHMGELCAYPPTGLKEQLDHAWPTAMNNICRDVGEPLTKKIDVAHDLCNVKDDEISCDWWEINNLCDKLAEEQCHRCRLEDHLAWYKGKWKDESEVTMGSPLLHKCQVAGHLPPPMLLAVYMPADIPAEVDIPPPKMSKDDHGAHILCDPMEDMFNWHYTSKLSTDDMPNPLKRRSRKKKSQGSLTTSSPILWKRRMLTWALS